MQRINPTTVELTREEQIVHSIHSNLMDIGYDQISSYAIIYGMDPNVPPKPDQPILDSTRSPEFAEWLTQ